MRSRISILTVSIFLFAACAVVGCGGEDLVLSGMLNPTATPAPTATPGGTCLGTGQICTFASNCCSGVCLIDNLCE
jgi:hypothetical protein